MGTREPEVESEAWFRAVAEGRLLPASDLGWRTRLDRESMLPPSRARTRPGEVPARNWECGPPAWASRVA